MGPSSGKFSFPSRRHHGQPARTRAKLPSLTTLIAFLTGLLLGLSLHFTALSSSPTTTTTTKSPSSTSPSQMMRTATMHRPGSDTAGWNGSEPTLPFMMEHIEQACHTRCQLEKEHLRERAAAELKAAVASEAGRVRQEIGTMQSQGGAEGARPDSLGAKLVSAKTSYHHAGFVKGPQISNQFFSWMFPFRVDDVSLFLTTPSSGFKAHDAPPGSLHDLQDLTSCKEVDVVITGPSKCYVLLGSGLASPPQGVNKFSYSKEENEWRRVTRIPHEGKTPPIKTNTDRHEEFLRVLLNNVEDLQAVAAPILRRAAGDGKVVAAMAVNHGDLDTLVNFVCAATKHGVDLSNVVVFGTDPVVVNVAESLGLISLTHQAFGSLPLEHAEHYGDRPFLEMMWLKTVSAWLVNRMGYDVLFQDADIVWFKPFLHTFDDPKIDGYFMDDGARSQRFSPYSTNSGFFFLRKNIRTTHFLQSLLWVQDLTHQWGSHQTTFIQTIDEHVMRTGLSIKLLPQEAFAGGRMYHHEKAKMNEVVQGKRVPYTFHLNWTQFKADKYKMANDISMWYVADSCREENIIQHGATGDSARQHISPALCCKPPSYGP